MKTVKVGLLVSFEGPTGLWAASCIQAAVLSAAEINVGGGTGGGEFELIVKNAAWDPACAAEAALSLIEDDGVSAIVSMTGSHARKAITFETADRCPFIYTPNFEQSGDEPNTIAISATDDHMIGPVLDWLFERLSARRFVMVGSDFRWSLRTMPMTAGMIRARGGQVDGMLVRPIDADTDWDDAATEAIRAAKPDCVLVFLIGDQAIAFHNAFHRSGLAGRIPRCAVATDEVLLCNLDPDAKDELYAGSYYFASVHTAANRSFMERYWTAFGAYAPVPGFFGQSCYEGIQFAAGLIRNERTANPKALVHAQMRQVPFRSARFETPSANLASHQPVYVAKANGNAFDILARF